MAPEHIVTTSSLEVSNDASFDGRSRTPQNDEEADDTAENLVEGPHDQSDIEGSDCENISGSDDEGPGNAQDDEENRLWHPPSLDSALVAHEKIKRLLFPHRTTGPGYKNPNLNPLFASRLRGMRQFLWSYIDVASPFHEKWIPASLSTAKSLERGPWYAQRLRHWTSVMIKDETQLPHNIYGTWNTSSIDDEDLQQEIMLHLQSIGKYISAQDIKNYMDQPEVQARYHRKKGISLRTAQNWLNRLGFRWTKEPKGQYCDGHERNDVVAYRQQIFLPKWKLIEPHLWIWSQDGKTEVESPGQKVVAWFHDESTYYAHDRRQKRWVNILETPVPQPKGEGASLMVADFISADYGWLCSPDGRESARVLFRAGKARDGYFTNDNIVAQVRKAMDILKKYFPQDKHVFVFDNATTHAKRPPTAPAA